MGREEEIQVIAYKLWEEEGRPEGRAVDHWLKAMAAWKQSQKQEAPVLQPAVSARASVVQDRPSVEGQTAQRKPIRRGQPGKT